MEWDAQRESKDGKGRLKENQKKGSGSKKKWEEMPIEKSKYGKGRQNKMGRDA